jgi:undecaprenyl-diphosphatase
VNPILTTILEQLPTHGPELLFALAFLETCFVTGLVVPSGLATSAATALALEGNLPLAPIVVAAVAGGALGDSLGFVIGRAWGRHVLSPGSRWSRMLGDRRAVVDEVFGKHPAFSVTAARLISFVRTVMPMAAGMSGLEYRRYLPYELAGVVGWCVMYVAIGVLARESWELATQVVGVGGTLVFGVAALMGWRVVRARMRLRALRHSARAGGSAPGDTRSGAAQDEDPPLGAAASSEPAS